MDLVKLLSLLDSSSLHFVRVDQLGEFDAFEGFYPNANIQAVAAFEKVSFDELPNDWKERTGVKSAETFEKLKQIERLSLTHSKNERQTTFVNSWHVKDYESAAMWKQYLSNSHGVAIQSTYQRLLDSFEDYQDFNIFVGLVKYLDFDTTPIGRHNGLLPFIHKRKSFEHEDELRALIWTPQHGKNVIGNPALNKFRDVLGLRVPVSVDTLIEQIYVAPTAPSWLPDLLRSIVIRFGIDKNKVTPSALAQTPLY